MILEALDVGHQTVPQPHNPGIRNNHVSRPSPSQRSPYPQRRLSDSF